MRFAVIGTGKMGTIISRSFSRYGQISRVLSCHKGAAVLADEHNAALSSFNDIVEDDLDAVIVATPISALYNYTSALLARDHRVFVEKPCLTSSSDDLVSGHVYVNFSWLKEDFFVPATGDVEILWEKTRIMNEDVDLNLLVHPAALAVHHLGSPLSASRDDNRLETKFECGRKMSVELRLSKEEIITICGRKYLKNERRMTIDSSVDEFILSITGKHRVIPDLEFARKVMIAIGR